MFSVTSERISLESEIDQEERSCDEIVDGRASPQTTPDGLQ